MKKYLTSNLFIFSILFSLAILWLYIIFNVQESYYGYGGGDNILHYMIARFSFQHPELFLHHWGKPIFTILSSPFAQFGIKGSYIFNILVSLASCFLVWKISKKLNLKYPILGVVFLALAPSFFFTATSSLTEPLFALFSILFLFLFINKRYILAVIIFSFTIFIRTEALIFFPLIVFSLILLKKWKAIPFLISGFIFLSIIGSFYYKDFFWFFTMMPYTLDNSLYGSGSLWHFIRNYKNIFGLPFTYLLLGGYLLFFLRFISQKEYRNKETISLYSLIFGIPLLFLMAHSWVWYKGIGSSLGLLRMMVCILPFAAIIANIGLDYLLDYVKKEYVKKIGYSFVIVLSLWAILFIYRYPKDGVYKKGMDESLMIETADYLLKENYENRKIFYFNSILAFLLDKDPWTNEIHSITQKGLHSFDMIEEGDILVWDAHFGPNEGRIQLDSLLQNKNLKLFMVFFPEQAFEVLGGYNYEIYCFEKLAREDSVDNYALLEDKLYFLFKQYDAVKWMEKSFSLKDTMEYGAEHISSTYYHSNNASYKVLANQEFYGFLEQQYSQIYNMQAKKILIEALVLNDNSENPNAHLVFSIENNGSNLVYKAEEIKFQETEKWETQIMYLNIINPETENDIIKSYIWNQGLKPGLYIDNYSIYLLK